MHVLENNLQSNWCRIFAHTQNSNCLKCSKFKCPCISKLTICNPIDVEHLHNLKIPTASCKNFPSRNKTYSAPHACLRNVQSNCSRSKFKLRQARKQTVHTMRVQITICNPIDQEYLHTQPQNSICLIQEFRSLNIDWQCTQCAHNESMWNSNDQENWMSDLLCDFIMCVSQQFELQSNSPET